MESSAVGEPVCPQNQQQYCLPPEHQAIHQIGYVNGITQRDLPVNARSVTANFINWAAAHAQNMSNSNIDGTTVPSEIAEYDQRREDEILIEQQKVENVRVAFFNLYRDATRWDIVILAVSTLLAIAGGAILPIMTVQPCLGATLTQKNANNYTRWFLAVLLAN